MTSKYIKHVDLRDDVKQQFNIVQKKLEGIREKEIIQSDLVKEMLDLYIKEQKRRYRKW